MTIMMDMEMMMMMIIVIKFEADDADSDGGGEDCIYGDDEMAGMIDFYVWTDCVRKGKASTS